MNLKSAQSAILAACKSLYDRGMIVGIEGNVSCRLGKARFLITPSGLEKHRLRATDLVTVDGTGKSLRGKRQPSSEIAVHLAVYEERPEAEAVIHAHPPHTIALSVTGHDFRKHYFAETVVGLGQIGQVPYVTPGTQAIADTLRPEIRRSRSVVVLARHGVIAFAKQSNAALAALEMLEQTSKVMTLVKTMGGTVPLPPDEIERLTVAGK